MSIISDSIDPSRLREADIAAYHEHGYVVLRGMVAAGDCVALRDEILAIMSAIGLPDGTPLRQSGEYLAGSALDRHVNGEGLRELAARLVGGPCRLYLPFTAVKAPGGGKFSFHQDNQYTRLDGPAVNLWLALTPMGEAEGTLRMLPGSHRQGTLKSVESTDAAGHRMVDFAVERFQTLELEPGDLVAFSRLTVHGSGANRSASPRIGYATQFHRDDVRAFFDERWELLTERPRWPMGPVARIGVPSGKQDGH
ncbi:MAG TPA: phytanoyl-CoA dioxygenase family protein [Planctomycetota bacterium]|nr:phytanoyl-CoA dioxygenase family protein [Planctomycetota bacterium]